MSINCKDLFSPFPSSFKLVFFHTVSSCALMFSHALQRENYNFMLLLQLSYNCREKAYVFYGNQTHIPTTTATSTQGT